MKRIYLVLALVVMAGIAHADSLPLGISYEVTPSSINAGGSAQIVVTVENEDSATNIDELTISLVSKRAGLTVSQGGVDLNRLSAGSTTSAAFTVRASDNLAPGTYVVEARGAYEYGTNTSSFKINVPITISYRSNLEVFALETQVVPGGTENLILTLTNSGGGVIKDLLISLTPSDNYIYPVGNVKTSISGIQAGEGSEANFKIRASDSATIGIHPVTVTVTYSDEGGATQTDTASIGIAVVSPGTEVIVDRIASNLEPGKIGTATIAIRNVGSVDLENVYVSINATSELRINGSNEKLVGSLPAGGAAEVYFSFEVSSDAEARPVPAYLSIVYQREGGKVQITDVKSLGIEVSGFVDLRVIDVEVNKEDSEIEVDIANYGNKDAEAVKVEILEDGMVTGTSFTDNIKPNKHKVFRFDLPQRNMVVVKATYKDYAAPDGVSASEESISLKEEDLAGNGGVDASPIILLLIIVVILFWYWRKRKGEEKKIDVSKFK
jgi:VCBS repeat-containing protein